MREELGLDFSAKAKELGSGVSPLMKRQGTSKGMSVSPSQNLESIVEERAEASDNTLNTEDLEYLEEQMRLIAINKVERQGERERNNEVYRKIKNKKSLKLLTEFNSKEGFVNSPG